MSLDAYIDEIMNQSKDSSGVAQCDRACLIGKDGKAWTSTQHGGSLALTAEEAGVIAKQMTSGDFTLFKQNGILVGGVKYTYLNDINKRMVLGQKQGNGAITLCTSGLGIVIAHTREGGSQALVNKAAGYIADYMESIGM